MKTLCILSVALLLVGSLSAQMTIDRQKCGHKWGYRESFAAAYQHWNGAPFIMEADFRMPEGDFVRDSWFGLWIDDTKQQERYILSLFNELHNARPERLSFSIVYYKPGKGFQRARSGKSWFTKRKKVTLKAEFTGDRLIFSSANSDGAFKKRLEIPVEKGFSPNQIGISLDNAVGNPVRNLQVTAFRIQGKGPAKSDPLDGTAPVRWSFLNEKNTDYEYPDSLKFSWYNKSVVPCGWAATKEEPNVFDCGKDAVIGIQAKTWIYDGKTLSITWNCSDYFGRPVADGTKKILLKRKENIRDTLSIPGKLLKNGIYKLEVNASVDGKKLPVLKQQFAVIPAREITPGKFDPESPYTFNYSWYGPLAARMGAKKIRQPYWSEKEYETGGLAKMAHENGLLMNGPLLQVRVGNEEMPFQLEQEAKRIADIFAGLKKKYPGIIDCQEIYNEPEALMGKHSELTGFVSLFPKVKRYLQESGSKVKLMGCGPLHCNLDYLKRTAVVGGPDCVDIVATHGYRSPNRPEFGHAEDIGAIHDLYGKDKPIYCNEDAYFTYVKKTEDSSSGVPAINQPFGTMIELDELTQGIYVQRKHLNQLMAGYAAINQFNDIDNHRLMLSATYMRPGVVTYSALTWLMKHPKFQKRLTPETDHLWILEWESDGETCHTFWSLNDFHKVRLTSDSSLVAYDTFANEIASGREIVLKIGGAPVFVKGKGMRLAERSVTTEKPVVILPEEPPLSETPVAVEIAGNATGMNSAEIRITVKNNSGKVFRGSIQPYFMSTGTYRYVGAEGETNEKWGFQPASSDLVLKPGERRELVFRPFSRDPKYPFDPTKPDVNQNYSVLWWTEGYRITALLKGSGIHKAYYSKRPLSLRGIPYKSAITVDAEDSEWKDVPVFAQLGDRKRNAGHAHFWYGRNSYYPEFKFAWNEKGLLFFAKVIDSRHDDSQKGLKAWRTDSIQIGLNSRHAHPDYTNWPLLTLSTANREVYLQRDTQRFKAGPLKQIEFKTRRIKGSYSDLPTTMYECLIPWEVIGLDIAKEKTFGFSLLFNNSNGFWRCGWEGYFQPMGGQIVDPKTFGDLTLIRR